MQSLAFGAYLPERLHEGSKHCRVSRTKIRKVAVCTRARVHTHTHTEARACSHTCIAFAIRHVRKHPSVFSNLIDGENISVTPPGLYLHSRVFKDPISRKADGSRVRRERKKTKRRKRMRRRRGVGRGKGRRRARLCLCIREKGPCSHIENFSECYVRVV